MKNDLRLTTFHQERIDRKQLLYLYFEKVRQSGQSNYPPLIKLFKLHEQQKTFVPSPLEGVNVRELLSQATTNYESLLQANRYLQNLQEWDSSPQIQEVVQQMARSAKVLEILLRPIFFPNLSEDSPIPENSPLGNLFYLREFLLENFSDLHFFLPQKSPVERRTVFFHHHRRRVYKYLSSIEAVAHELIEQLNLKVRQHYEE
jgi:hypothetical protein